MKKKEVSQYKLLKSGVDNKTLDSLKKNKNRRVSLPIAALVLTPFRRP